MANQMNDPLKGDKKPSGATLKTVIPRLRAMLRDFLLCLAFFTRLPVSLSFEQPADMSKSSRMFPATGLIIGGIGSLAMAVAWLLGLPVIAVSVLAVATMILATGALHEDGLADMVDGFGGGRDRMRKLEIMKDSHIGTYGVLALVLSQGLRISLLSALISADLIIAMAALTGSAVASRAASMVFWSALPPARKDGLSRDVGQPDRAALTFAMAMTLIVLLAVLWWSAGPAALVAAVVVSGLSIWLLIGLCHHQIGGQTGDTIGAAQQISELAFMAGLLMSVGNIVDLT
uniref:adenosylcobinamide-GDP ribazoletransferase n=1 Tax=Pararhizobium sp. IMCC3301 TaxID=3067904 RepID=UPI002740B6B0|nr:adenosylcobinamide-GDP ribazoletransferase [Pararhizobium sp. IMCC3301]